MVKRREDDQQRLESIELRKLLEFPRNNQNIMKN
jgi:hypothetical protein